MKTNDLGKWLLALGVAGAALVGCGEDAASGDSDQGPVAGEGGEGGGGAGGGGAGGGGAGGGGEGGGGMGGDAGEGGGGAGGAPVCGVATVIDFIAGATEAGGVYTLAGTTDAANNFEGRCGGEDEGGDVAVAFTAPAGGFWEFSTEGTGFDSVLYALRDCNSGFSEFACSNDVGPGQLHSRVVIEVDAGDTVYLVVDQFTGTAANAFTLKASPTEPMPPAITGSSGALYPDGFLGVRIQGTDSAEVTDVRIELLDDTGTNVIDTIEAPIAEIPFAFLLPGEDGAFEFLLAAGLGADLAAVVKTARIGLINSLTFETTVDVALDPPPAAALGATCDNLVTRCVAGADCAVPEGAVDGSCEPAPVVTGGLAYRNPTDQLLGVEATGTYTGAEIAGFAVLPLAADGSPLSVFFDGQNFGGPATFGANVVSAGEGMFTARVAFFAFFVEACVDVAQDGAAFEACLEETYARVDRIQVVPIDAEGLRGAPFEVAFGERTQLESGAACDVPSVFDLCPEGDACFTLDAEPAICALPVVECAEAWPVIDLAEHADGDRFVYAGDSSRAMNVAGGGTCGGGGPHNIHRFTAAAAGTYTATISNTNGDTLLFVRSHCALGQPAYELGCNDDIEQGNLLSSVTFELEAGASAYLFVDGYNGGFAGTYTLTVAPR